MPGTTVPLGYPYPLPTDPTNGPAAIKALADAVDASVAATYVSAATALAPPTCKVLGATQTVPNNTLTTLLFNQVVIDNASMSDLISAPSAVRITSTMRYLFEGQVQWAPSAASYRLVNVLLNGTVLASEQVPPATQALFPTTTVAAGLRTVSVGDTFTMQALQVTGGDLQVVSCSLTVHRFDD